MIEQENVKWVGQVAEKLSTKVTFVIQGHQIDINQVYQKSDKKQSMLSKKTVFKIAVAGCLLWSGIADNSNCIFLDENGNCLARAQTFPTAVPQNVIPSGNILGAPETLLPFEYAADPTFIQLDAKLRRQYRLNQFTVVQVTRQVVDGSLFTVTYGDNQGNTQKFKVHASFLGDLEITGRYAGRVGENQQSVPIIDPVQPVVPPNNPTNPTNPYDQQNQYPPYSDPNKETHNLRFYGEADYGKRPQNNDLEEIKTSKGFASCYQALLETYSHLFNTSPEITDINVSQDGYGLFTYRTSLLANNQAYIAVLQYNTNTQTPFIISIVAQSLPVDSSIYN